MAGYCPLVDEVEQLRQANAGLKALLEAQSRGMAKKTAQMKRERQRIRLYAREARAAEVRRLRRKVSQFAVRARAAEEWAEDDEMRADAAESLYLKAVERAEEAEEEAEDASAAAARSRAQWAEIAVDKTKQLAVQLRCRAEQAEILGAEMWRLLRDFWARTRRAEAEARAFGVDMFESSRAWRADCAAERVRADDLAVRVQTALAGLERERARADGPECYVAVLLGQRADRGHVGSAAGSTAAAGSPGPAGGSPACGIDGEVDGFTAGLAAQRQGSEDSPAPLKRRSARSEGSEDSTCSTGTVVHYEVDDDWVHDFELVRE